MQPTNLTPPLAPPDVGRGPSLSPPPAPPRLPAPPRRARDLSRVVLGVVVIAVGVLLVLDTAGVVSSDRAIGDWWPALIIAVGLIQLAERPRSVVGPLLVMGVGAALLTVSTGLVRGDVGSYIWPLIVVAIGVSILAHRVRPAPAGGERDDIHATALFGGPELASSSQQFRGASLTALFGGVKLDLRQAKLAPTGARIDATVAFGGVELLVPRGWPVTVNSTPILGGVADKTDHAVPVAPDAPTLHVDALAICGGVEIKHEH